MYTQFSTKRFNSAITSGTRQEVVPAKDGYIVVVDQIAGSSGEDLTFHDGDTATEAGITISAQDNFLLYDTAISTSPNLGLYIDAAANVTPDINVNYQYKQARFPLGKPVPQSI